ncbi:MAG: sigma-54 dependent transcriptional regulator [Lysobacterales bacterium]|jgi:DNA-binding NtrC family response regulator
MARALIIDDQPESLLKLSEAVAECAFEVDTARDVKAARAMMARQLPDVVVLNIRIGDKGDEDAAFGLFTRSGLGNVMEVYLVTDEPSIESAQRGMQVGASDYFQRPVDLERLRANLERLREELEPSRGAQAGMRDGGGLLTGESPAMSRVYRMIRKVAPTEATVLLVGESGSGKELIAQTIHNLSDRAGGPFVAMNCGAIPGELIESQMFGHRKGAFTGAHTSHKGFFERARGGTLLLDEITEMDADLQVKLLRVLETRLMTPVGGEREIEVDVRILASTNRDPDEAVAHGVLREDLYYRLAEFPMRVPPLRERGEDIVLLAREFLAENNQREDSRKALSPEAIELLLLHDWPGNVRELKNAISRAHILADGEVRPDDLPENIPSRGAPTGDYLRVPVGYSLKEVERRMILATLDHFDGDKPKAAETLGVSLKTLYNRLKTYSGGK